MHGQSGLTGTVTALDDHRVVFRLRLRAGRPDFFAGFEPEPQMTAAKMMSAKMIHGVMLIHPLKGLPLTL